MNYKAIIFDLDGTLYDSKRLPLRLILGDMRGALTLRAERQARRELMGRDFGTEAHFRRAFFDAIARRCGTTADRVADWYDNRYMPLMVAVLQMYYTARPSTELLLAELRDRGIRTIVYSDYGEVEAKLRAIDIDPAWVDGMADAPSLGGLKPCAEAARRLADRFALDPRTTLVVGDRDDTDGATARAIGADFRDVKRPRAWDALIAEVMQR